MTAVCEDYYHLDLAWLQRRRILTPGRKSVVTWSSCGSRTGAIKIAAAEHAILLVYRTREYGEEWQDVKQLVVFKTTATAFGGRRRWFACPGCAKACRVLYGSARFLCRRCWRRPYRSQRESPWSRTTSRIAEDAGPARRLRQPDGTLSAATAVHAPPHISKVVGALPLVVATEHG